MADTPQCPACGYSMSYEDMQDCEEDLFFLAPNEARAVVKCPSCNIEYWVEGGYKPNYTSALAEEDL